MVLNRGEPSELAPPPHGCGALLCNGVWPSSLTLAAACEVRQPLLGENWASQAPAAPGRVRRGAASTPGPPSPCEPMQRSLGLLDGEGGEPRARAGPGHPEIILQTVPLLLTVGEG